MMLTGDQVLPKITPNVSVFACAGDDPLGDYLASLTKLSAYPGDVVLPAHEYEFGNLHERIDELHAHHAARLDNVRAALGDGRDTAWRIASKVRWSVHWDAIDSLMKRSALGETLAHLIYLEKIGQAGKQVSARPRSLAGSPCITSGLDQSIKRGACLGHSATLACRSTPMSSVSSSVKR